MRLGVSGCRNGLSEPTCRRLIRQQQGRAGCPQEGLFEEAALLRERELDMKARLGGPPDQAPPLPCVDVADVEAVVSAWTGIPAERMGADDRERLLRMEPALQVGGLSQPVMQRLVAMTWTPRSRLTGWLPSLSNFEL
jgi:ATP-dependent Clp protease ATP-binding subunit ClpC